ncbi:C39 family peptidase [Synoicihabitans lomoniglobus]|uniref:C39 family peptidase n=1 Tax=Synoicihabitans lomoniglobus TaxID=2909285 RepID=A0AAE9ZVI5_9BACT|nr:C39 family peptidase [Opitutaceae bacterium LMO-M01]WED63854.1 C39 family peptidase [Opitutaceae bacterium LMO-M01]
MSASASPPRHSLALETLPQPDDTTCGPTCLHAIYRYFGEEIPLPRLIKEVPKLETGGTLGVLLATDALRRGYQATIYSYNLQVFDPTWFGLDATALVAKLAAQRKVRRSEKLKLACAAYEEYLKLGGRIRFEPLSGALIRRYLNRNVPILAGLSSTYLYQAMREHGPNDDDDDLRGNPSGHFVVMSGYDRKERLVHIADPLQSNPHSQTRRYAIDINRVLSSVLLGVLTYDANLMVIHPPSHA